MLLSGFRILLRYYDKWYLKALQNRDNLDGLLYTITCNTIDVAANAEKLLEERKKLTAVKINS